MLFSPGEEQGEESRKLAEIRHHRHVSQALRAKSPNERPRAIINEVRAINRSVMRQAETLEWETWLPCNHGRPGVALTRQMSAACRHGAERRLHRSHGAEPRKPATQDWQKLASPSRLLRHGLRPGWQRGKIARRQHQQGDADQG